MSPEPAAPKRWLALGDSYTIGEGVAESERWPSQLSMLLADAGVVAAAPEVLATTGWTSDELLAAMSQADLVGPFDWLCLLIGVNDQYRGRSVVEYGRTLRALHQRIDALVGGHAERVVVLSIPDWGRTPFAQSAQIQSQGRDPGRIALEIDGFNAHAQAEATAQGYAWLDITDLGRRHADDPSMRVADDLHPSARMYALWAERLLPLALRALATR